MLVLSRKVGERICIGDDVSVTVVCVEGNRVRLGFEAPRDVSVYRSEVSAREAPAVGRDGQRGRFTSQPARRDWSAMTLVEHEIEVIHESRCVRG